MKNNCKSCWSFLSIAFLLLLGSCAKKNADPTVQEKHTSFEVEVVATPKSLTSIASGAYTYPESAYGQPASIDFCTNYDNTIDVFWMDNTQKKHISRISLDTKALVKDITIPLDANMGGRHLGFEKLGHDTFIIGYSKNNSSGDVDAEAWYTAFDITGKILFSTRIFGDISLAVDGSKGAPAQAGSAVIRYNASKNAIAVYLAHTQRYSTVRHQGGWVGFLNPTTGAVLKDTKGAQIGSGWFYSHNFDQRCFVSSSNLFYMLSHGDAYPRALGISAWNAQTGLVADFQYYKIQNGTTGDNTTLATTGDFTELSDGTVAIAYSTKDGRVQRDLRVALVAGMGTKTPSLSKETWITNYTDKTVGWGAKIASYGTGTIVLWNTFSGKTLGSTYAAQLDKTGNLTSSLDSIDAASLYPSQTIRPSNNNGNLIWVSAGAGNTLKVHLLRM